MRWRRRPVEHKIAISIDAKRIVRGSITTKELDWSEAQIRDFVTNRKAANPHLSIVLGDSDASRNNGCGVDQQSDRVRRV
jgi:hypothetical protein